jgi:hypothetical protein
MTLPDGAVIGAVAFAAPWLESDPDVVAGWIDRRSVLSPVTAIDAGVIAGRAADLRDALVPDGVGQVACLPAWRRGPAGIRSHGSSFCGRAGSGLVLRRPGIVSARIGVGRASIRMTAPRLT